MKKIKIGQIGIGHNHGEGKMLAVQKFPELFEAIGYAEENEKWVEKRGNLSCYKDLPRLSVEEIIEKSDAILVECDVWNLTKFAKMCVEAGKHVHIDKPASGTLAEFEEILNIAKEKNLTVQMGYMYRYNFAIQKLMDMINSGELGEIYQIDAEMSTYHSKEYREWLKHFKGGSMYIFGSHLIDLVVSILGEPGSLRGVFSGKSTGKISTNSYCGVFGNIESIPDTKRLKIASKNNVRPGKAQIRCDIGKGVESFDIEIVRITSKGESTKSMVIKITDEKLISKTGGIVQGMSGSPLIQNGKLIGAVTHVFVNDPTRGYGIFIENMLAEAEKIK